MSSAAPYLALVVCACLYGFVHSGSKLILQQGLPIYAFVFLNISIRLALQFVIWIIRGRRKINIKASLMTILFMGCLVALFNIMEFLGIAEGIPVPVVTLLVYSHPIWTLLTSRFINKYEITQSQYLRVAVGFIGLLFILGEHLIFNSRPELALLAPLFAGLSISLWISSSHQIQRNGTDALNLSFTCDLVGWVIIALFISNHTQINWSSVELWSTNHMNWIAMVVYATFMGLVPNLLFYFGSSRVKPVVSSLILLLEPVVSVVAAKQIWNDPISKWSYIGAALVLTAAIPWKKQTASFS